MNHGTLAAYKDGCHCRTCRQANTRYSKWLRLQHIRGRHRLIDSTGTRRRILALMVMRHRQKDIGAHLGVDARQVRFWLTQPFIQRETAARIAELYERLCMTRGPGNAATEIAGRRAGGFPPLAWDDIDNDPAPVGLLTSRHQRQDVDPMKVERAIDGDRTVRLNPQERNQAVAVLVARGLTDRRIAAVLGCTPETVLRSRTRQGIAPAVPATWTKGAA